MHLFYFSIHHLSHSEYIYTYAYLKLGVKNSKTACCAHQQQYFSTLTIISCLCNGILCALIKVQSKQTATKMKNDNTTLSTLKHFKADSFATTNDVLIVW